MAGKSMCRCLLLSILISIANIATAQLADTTISWKDYSRVASADVKKFEIKEDKRRSYAIIVDEIADNRGSPAIDDARFVIQKIARDFGIDPTTAYWIFRWTESSFVRADTGANNSNSGKQLLIMGTMGRSKTNTLTGPSWKVISPDRLIDITDRQWTK